MKFWMFKTGVPLAILALGISAAIGVSDRFWPGSFVFAGLGVFAWFKLRSIVNECPQAFMSIAVVALALTSTTARAQCPSGNPTCSCGQACSCITDGGACECGTALPLAHAGDRPERFVLLKIARNYLKAKAALRREHRQERRANRRARRSARFCGSCS